MRETLQRAMKDGQILEIVYMAKDGSISQRHIHVLSIKGEIIMAYCFLREKKRMFHIGQLLAAFPARGHRRRIG